MKRLLQGSRILVTWFGAGGKGVFPAVAQSRANVCLECPQNARKTLWGLLETPVSKTIRAVMAYKEQRKIAVRGEENLGTCRVCLCHLPLKVHVPIAFIAEETDAADLAEFPDFCWVKREINHHATRPA